MRVDLPDAPSGEWREVRWQNGARPQELERVSLEVEPPTAFRQLRVYREAGPLLANESWDPSRSRGVRIWPVSHLVRAGEALVIRAMAWWPTPVHLTAVFTWKEGSA